MGSIPKWLVFVLGTVFILRIPSLFEPLWYGDEAIYLTLGEGIRQGFTLYKDIHDNKPPLIYLLAAVSGNLFWFKAILTFFVLSSVFFFWKLTDLLFPKKELLQKISTIIFSILTTLPLLEGNIVNAELLILATTIGGFGLLFSKTKNRGVLAGLMVGTGVLFKSPAIFDVAVPVIFWLTLLLTDKKEWTQNKRLIIPFLLAAISPLALSFLVFSLLGTLGDYLNSAFIQTAGYISSWRLGGTAGGDFLANNQPLIMRGSAALLIIAVLANLARRKKINSPLLFTSIWFVLSLFAVTLSERPYPHYLIQLVPSFSLLAGVAVANKTEAQFLAYPLFAILGGTLLLFKFYYYPVFPYYQNFLSFVAGRQTVESYFDNFDKRTSRNYRIARDLNESLQPQDSIFIWGNDPEIYVLTHKIPPGRFVVAYHIKEQRAEKETVKALQENLPRYIVTLTEAFRELEELLSARYILINADQGSSTYLRLNKVGKR